MSHPRDTTSSTTKLNAELLAMVRIASSILQYSKLDDILTTITRELSPLIRFDRSSIALVAPDQQSLILHPIYAGPGEAGKLGEGRRLPLNEKTAIGWVVLNRRAILRSDVATDGRFLDVVGDERLGCDMSVPLIAHGNVIGTLNLGCFEPDALVDSDLEKLVNCGNIAGCAIEHAMLLEEAKDLGERYRTLQRDASDIIMLIDRNSGRLLEVNRQCCTALGFKEEDLLRKAYFDLFPPEDQFQARRDFVNIMSQKSRVFVDRRFVGRDGTIIFVDVSASLVQIKSDTFIQVMVHDISQRKMLEQQIILQNRNLQDANQKLRQVDQMKTEFLANISHELRTPLSVIIAYTEAMRDGLVGEEDRRHFLDVISDNGDHLLRLINDLLDLSKLEVSEAMLSFSLSHIHDVVRSLWPKVIEAAGQKRIEVAFTPGYEIPVVYIDNRRITQVFLCLVQNAIKFTDAGGRVEVSTLRSEEGVVIQVRDTGAGISEEQIPHIFDTFRQLDGSSTRRWGGLGIGLAIARHIVELHGGKIWVESKRGEGSTFAFTIPIETDEVLRNSGEPQTPARNLRA
ncbi:MAG TPA: ATP-binding protein [Candidatus Krumholzibacteria bacterium]|nr:ATP-binding protein [Candidatus Krumholzibacteria bacterium]